MRLRRLRNFNQAQLAKRMKTKQPAIARIESGRGNPRLSTLVELADALGATVRIEMNPVETVCHGPPTVPWWRVTPGSEPAAGLRGVTLQVQQNLVVVLPGTRFPVGPGSADPRELPAATAEIMAGAVDIESGESA